MRAIVSTKAGVQLRDLPIPVPKPNEILVRVKATSLNRIDLVAVRAPADQVIGAEWAGDVVEVGAEVTQFKPGDRVMGSGAAAYADYAVTDSGRACAIPNAGLSYEEATVLPMALQTMHNAIVTEGRFVAGETILVHGASSGVGLMGLQMTRFLGAGTVIGTSTNPARRSRLKEFGADMAIDSSNPEWVSEIHAATGGRGVELIIDQVSGPRFNQTMQAAAVRGRIINVGRLGGAMGEFDFNLHALNRLSYIGVTFRTRTVSEVRALNAAMLTDLSDAIAGGKLRLPIDERFPLENAAQALERMASNVHFGKIVLTL